MKEWPTGGPKVLWTANDLGSGYGSMAVAGDRVFLQGARGATSMVIALNRADGKEVWSKALGPVETKMRSDRGAGPRGTPTVDGDRLYVLTENGDLACLKTDGYSEKGRFEIPDKGMPSWAHPVISDGRLYVRNQETLLVYDIKAAR